MGKMSEIAFMLETGDEKGLVEFFGNYGWRKSVSEIGGKEFLKAFDEINKDKKKKKKKYQKVKVPHIHRRGYIIVEKTKKDEKGLVKGVEDDS